MPRKGNSQRLRKGRVSQPFQVYHIRVATWNRRPIFNRIDVGRCVVQSLIQVQGQAETVCYCLMPDHLHWLLELQPSADLSVVVQKMKSLATKSVFRRDFLVEGSLWQRGFFDHAVRRDENLLKVARYIVANPLRAGLVDSVGDYSLWDAVWL